MTPNRWNLPELGFGVGLRTVHFQHILDEQPAVDWFEIISENFMDTKGKPSYILDQVREQYPVVMHGVSLSIAGTDPLNIAYLHKLKALAERVNSPWVSDHLCWTGCNAHNLHDLLPIIYTEENLHHIAKRIHTVAEIIERPIVLENVSTYAEFSISTMTEWEFVSKLVEEADCGLLLDVNNIYVSSYNHGFDPIEYINAMPYDRICQFHLAGHTNKGTHILDTHSYHVVDEVWELYRYCFQKTGARATLLEWDENIPPFDVVHKEALKAKNYRSTK
jgi:uncharacterized protein (UPF0276 family)